MPEDLPAEDNPFGDITSDPREAVPQPMNAGQTALAIAGLAVMTLGGLLVLIAAVLWLARDYAWYVGVAAIVLFFAGSGVCGTGYGLFNKARKRRPRRP